MEEKAPVLAKNPEKTISATPGGFGCVVFFTVLFFCIFGGIFISDLLFLWIVIGVIALFMAKGFMSINPNEAYVVQFFGNYQGTVKSVGLRWINPLCSTTAISLRIRNFETQKLKVNDYDGNPIEIAAVISWRVANTYLALFNVDQYEAYLKIQTEAALRNMVSRYPYDIHDDNEISLRGSTKRVGQQLKDEVQSHVNKAGLQILQAQISYLAYAPEIAAVMLQRQQANAIIAARQKIVEGAVGMVDMALHLLSENKTIELDEKQKVEMVSNLLVVLCSHTSPHPVVDTGAKSS